MFFSPSRVAFLTFNLSVGLLLLLTTQVFADVTIGDPAPSTVASCDDFFVKELNNPVDMSDTADVNNFFKDQDIRGLNNISIANGVFTGTAVSAQSPLFYLWSPFVCGSYPVGGRFGAKTSLGYDHVINFTPTLASKYNRLTVRMFHPAVTTGSGAAVRVRYDRDCSYGNQLSISSTKTLKEGWHTYSFDLTQAPASGVTTPWVNGDVTGLAIEPTQQNNAQVQVDWIRLEDPSSCNNVGVTVPYTANVTNNNTLMRFFIDDDTNPMNGFIKALSTLPQSATAAGNVSVSDITGVTPGLYYVNAIQDSDLATLWAANPWDFSSNDDIIALGAISGASFSGGVLSGTTTSTDANIFLALPANFPAADYSQLSIKITGSTIGDPAGPVRLLWNGGFKDLRTTDVEYQGGGLWHVNLGVVTGWSGTIDTFIVRPSIQAGQSFSLDFVSLRSSGFDTSRTIDSPQRFASSSRLRVNAPPVGQISKPDAHSAAALRPWNMTDGDFVLLTNMQSGADPTIPGENFCSFLPDVRRVDGLRGDFFKGANEAGNGDPNPHSVFPLFTENPITFAASDYKSLCYKMLIDKEFSLRDGHHGRILWENTVSYTSEDLVAIFDRWSGSRWYEYCVDMSKMPIDGQTTNPGWNGTVQKFRVDPHEWSHSFLNDDISVPPDATPISVPFYYDYIKLRKYPTAKRKHVLVYNATDSDDSSAQVQFFVNSTRSKTGGTQIPSGNLSCTGRVCIWDTTHLANGTYWIYGTVSDSRSSSSFQSPTAVIVDNTSDSTLAAPELVLERPTEGETVCNDLQLKGYALQTEPNVNTPVQAVQVLVDGQFFAWIDPIEYSPAAKTAYPNADSSNSGFNRLLDASALSTGAHTVTVTAYGVHGATTVKTFNITKQVGGTCPTPSVDAEPAGRPLNAVVGIPPGAGVGLSLSVTPSGNDLLYGISGIDNKCSMVRIKIAENNGSLTNGPFTFIQTITDRSLFSSGTLNYFSEDIPKLVFVTTAPSTPSQPQCSAVKKYRTCAKKCPKNGKRRRSCLQQCEKRSKCTTKRPVPRPTAGPTGDTTASIQADCGDGTGVTSAVEVDARNVGNAAKPVSSIAGWVDALRLSGKLR